MGAYLSQPVTEKEAFDGPVGGGVRHGGCAMQGWRRSMEDAHVVVSGLCGNDDDDLLVDTVFGVFDGHGGSEVARFCRRHLPSELKRQLKDSPDDVQRALIRAFHRMDEMLRDAGYRSELLRLRESNDLGDAESCEGDDSGSQPGSNNSSSRASNNSNNNSSSVVDDDDDDDDDVEGVVLQHLIRRLMFTNGNGSQQGEGVGAELAVHAGATAIVAYKRGNQLFVANAGDSRGVLCRSGRAVPLSVDHKPGMERERSRIVAAGGFLSEIAGMYRVNGNLNLSRAIGDLRYKANEKLKAKEQIITAEPDVKVLELTGEDSFFVLACDGVWDVMGNQQVVDFVAERLAVDGGRPLSEICGELLDKCLAEDPKTTRGVGCDNMTIMVVDLRGG